MAISAATYATPVRGLIPASGGHGVVAQAAKNFGISVLALSSKRKSSVFPKKFQREVPRFVPWKSRVSTGFTGIRLWNLKLRLTVQASTIRQAACSPVSLYVGP